MSSHNPGESDVTATAAIEPALGRHWTKRLARLMGVPHETARHWVYRRMPADRRCEIARALIDECDRLERVIAETRRRWVAEVGDEASGVMARGKADRARTAVRPVGGKMKR